MRLKMRKRPALEIEPRSSLNEHQEQSRVHKQNKKMPLDAKAETDLWDVGLPDGCEATRSEPPLFWMECAKARKIAGLSRKDVAGRMETTASAIARMETFVPGRKQCAPGLDDTGKEYLERVLVQPAVCGSYCAICWSSRG